MTISATYLSYPDAAVAIAWLEGLGFRVITRQNDSDGTVTHAELRLGSAVVMLAQDDQPYVIPPLKGQSTGIGVYLTVDDVDGLYDSAITAGGTVVFAPEDTTWGARRARVLDPAGREWSFGTYVPAST